MTEREFIAEYERLAHAVQTGVAHQMANTERIIGPLAQFPPTTPKHLRTGLDLVMADHGSLGRLLIAKGVISEEEYFETTLDGLRREIENLEHELSKEMGGRARITLA